ncbi:hypothetical protein EV426DRAFT_571557 [Tirmania nivea]|nr:hypothetical protein EV426DRAFT_571557 [Tirmania nivea]
MQSEFPAPAQPSNSVISRSTDPAQQQLQATKPQPLHLTAAPPSGTTLLPTRIASLVSTFSKSTTFSIRLSSLIGQLLIDSARTTTLSSLELARAGIEGVLLRAYQDVEARRISQRGGSHIDHGWTESMLNRLHATITFSQLLISSGFEASATGLNAIKELSQGWIYVIDSVFGETESSRAINAILSLIIQEFGPAEDKKREGTPVGVMDLLAGLACFAILQKRGKRRRTKEIKTEIIWDVVVGDSGSSVIRRRVKNKDKPLLRSRRPSLVKIGSNAPSAMNHNGLLGEDEAWRMVRGDENGTSVCSDESDYSYTSDRSGPTVMSKDELAAWLQRLPPAARASITSTTTTKNRTTIEVTGVNNDNRGRPMELDFVPPKNATILAEESNHGLGGEAEGGAKNYRIVYETVQKKVRAQNVLQDGEGGRVIVEETNAPDADFGNDDTDLVMLNGTSWRAQPVCNVNGADKPRGSSGKHALEDSSKKLEREKKRDRKHKEKKGKEIVGNTEHKSREGGRKDEKERGRDKKSKEKKKEKKSKGKERSDRSGRRKALPSIIHSSNQSPLLTPPSPSSRWKTPQTDYFSLLPDSHHAHHDSSYTTALKRSSSVTRTSTSSINLSSNSRRGSFVTSRQESMQAQTPAGTQLRGRCSREILPMSNVRTEPALISTPPNSPQSRRTGNTSYGAPSIHTLRTTHSQTSLSLEFIASGGSSARDDMMGRSYYPHDHLCRNMFKFMRFSSASYGSNFMRFLGIGAAASSPSALVPAQPAEHHAEHHAFSFHTSVPVDTILLSSFTDPGGGYDMHGEVNTGVPLVHYICLDHKAKAVVLTCRGTLGLDDVVTDLTCEYGDMEVRGKTYRVHKGMLNSALLLLKTRRAKVLMTLRDALCAHEGYGLILCGHSLGGGVASILSILLSTPTTRGGFVTANTTFQDVQLPEGRPVHCYAYGSPACVCSKLRIETRGLITSVVHGSDVVPSLSFGMIRDFHSVALAFKEDRQGLRREIGKTVLGNLTKKATGFVSSAMEGISMPGEGEIKYEDGADPRVWARGDVIFENRDDDYLYSILKTLRAGMDSEKLVPPGEVYVLETQTVFQQERDGGVDIKPATRVTTRVVQDVEKRFGELGFGRGMFSDHSPANYEGALELLLRGVCDDDVCDEDEMDT